MEITSDPTGEGLSPTGRPPLQVPRLPTTSVGLLPVGGSHDPLHLGFGYLPEQLTELRETLAYIYQFIKGCDNGHR